jgi:hypothetical protein
VSEIARCYFWLSSVGNTILAYAAALLEAICIPKHIFTNNLWILFNTTRSINNGKALSPPGLKIAMRRHWLQLRSRTCCLSHINMCKAFNFTFCKENLF